MFETKEGIIKPIVYVGILNNNRLLLIDYKQPPNPAKSGWWIPAPGLEFGEDPAERATKVASELGIVVDGISLKEIESFVTPGGWHLVYHYIARTQSMIAEGANIKKFKWVTSNELSEMTDMAHGQWEIGVGTGYLAELENQGD